MCKPDVIKLSIIATTILCLMITALPAVEKKMQFQERPLETIKLPPPRNTSSTSVEEALTKRRSVREFKKGTLRLSDVSQLLWAAQGISGQQGRRTAPSAGALYPLEVYILCADVESLSDGIYHYQPATHTLRSMARGDKRRLLAAAAMMQGAVSGGSAVLVISAKYQRTTVKYGERGKRYVHMEAGHAAQNVYLQAVSLGLNTVTIGAFSDNLVKRVMQLPEDEIPLYLMPLGK
ncbi:MAG TPA: SagB/ThcOx family dehydrogenase [Sphingobacteriaceae bacterium]